MPGLKIPFFGLKKQYNIIQQEILDVTDEVLRSGDLMGGNYTSDFESWIARKNNSSYAVTCHSGTHALEIIASYYKKPYQRPRVLVPAMTYVASANAFMRTGWDVQLIDTDYYGIMDPKQIDQQDDTSHRQQEYFGVSRHQIGGIEVHSLLIATCLSRSLTDACMISTKGSG